MSLFWLSSYFCPNYPTCNYRLCCVAVRQSYICFSLGPSCVLQLARERKDFVRSVFELKICVWVYSVKFLWTFLKPNQISARYNYTEVFHWNVMLSDCNLQCICATGCSNTFRCNIGDKSYQFSRVFAFGLTDIQTDGQTEAGQLALFVTFLQEGLKAAPLEVEVIGLLLQGSVAGVVAEPVPFLYPISNYIYIHTNFRHFKMLTSALPTTRA